MHGLVAHATGKTEMARHIKSGEQVIVIAGADKGKTGRVLRVLTDKNRVVVEGINRVWKHVRPSQRNPQGGRIQKDAPIHISNVMPIDPTTGKGTRVKFEEKDGVKHRVAVGTGADLGRTGKK
jgi:large subunit ribosomal protein L24